MQQIDLNSDMGEGFGRWSLGDDETMLETVTSANVACGFHAGDPETMTRVVTAAAARGVSIGAHVAYRISGARFEVIASDTRPDPAAPVCKIAPPPRLVEVMDAIRAADRIERTPHNGVRLSGHGRSLTLFGQ